MSEAFFFRGSHSTPRRYLRHTIDAGDERVGGETAGEGVSAEQDEQQRGEEDGDGARSGEGEAELTTTKKRKKKRKGQKQQTARHRWGVR